MTKRNSQEQWKTAHGLAEYTREQLDLLIDGAVEPSTTRVVINGISKVVKLAQVRLEHAKLTGRLGKGSDKLPNLKL